MINASESLQEAVDDGSSVSILRQLNRVELVSNTRCDENIKANAEVLDASFVSLPRVIQSTEVKPVNEIGSGAFAKVWTASWDNWPVAVKYINKDKIAEQFFDNETAIHSELDHPNIVKMHGMIKEEKNAIVMELMQEDLVDLIRKEEVVDTISLGYDFFSALAYLHDEKNIIHRDLKTDNVLVTSLSGKYTAKICDFGFAIHLAPAEYKRDEKVCGSPSFLAPELLGGRPYYSRQSDIYAACVVLWEMEAKFDYLGHLYDDKSLQRTLSNISRHVTAGRRAPIPHMCDNDVRQIIRAGWSQDPKMRPTAASIAGIFSKKLQERREAADNHQDIPLSFSPTPGATY